MGSKKSFLRLLRVTRGDALSAYGSKGIERGFKNRYIIYNAMFNLEFNFSYEAYVYFFKFYD